jgi:hypothetical protein
MCWVRSGRKGRLEEELEGWELVLLCERVGARGVATSDAGS